MTTFLLLISWVLINTSWATEIKSYKDHYLTNENVWVELIGKPGNEKDWIGIYPAGASNDWANVVSWVWAYDTSKVEVHSGDWYKFKNSSLKDYAGKGYFSNYAIQLPPGNYEARFFLNNSYNLVTKDTFTVQAGDETQLTLDKQSYAANDTLMINYAAMSGDPEDWLGIYKKGDSNDWANQKAWTWSGGKINGSASISYQNLAAGEYEVRAFFNNSFQVEAIASFAIVEKAFWEKGAYDIQLTELPNGKGVVYSPEGLADNLPVVVFVYGGASNEHEIKHKTVLNFIASHGYHAVFIHDVSYLYPARTAEKYVEAINELEKIKGVNTRKLGVVGHSSGGGAALGILKTLKNNYGYGTDKSFVLAIDPWFALEMKQQDLLALPENSYALILQFGEGGNNMTAINGVNYSTDALIPLTLFKYLNTHYPQNVDYKIFENVGEDRGHLYLYDNITNAENTGNNYESMKGGLEPLGALMEHTFKGNNPNAKAKALGNNESELQEIKRFDEYEFACKETRYGIISNDNGMVTSIDRNDDVDEDVEYCNAVPRGNP